MKNKPTNSAPWVAFYCTDFLDGTAGWTATERGAYIILLCQSWKSDGLPADPKRIFLIDPDIKDVWGTLESKFPLASDGKRRNPRQEDGRSEMIDISTKNSAAGLASAEARRLNARLTPVGTPVGTEPPTKPQPNFNPLPSPSPSPSPVPSHVPEPKQFSDSLEPDKKSARRQVVGITWDADSGFQNVTDSHKIAWRVAYPNCSVDTSLARMHVWLIANPSKAHKTNWLRFIANWFARTREDGGNLPPSRPTESNF